MSCETILPLIHGHLDGMNSEAEEAQLQAHLRDCPTCRALMEQYAQIDAQLQTMEVEPPEQFTAGVMYKVRSGSRKKRFAFGPVTMVAAAAALLLVIGSGQITSFLGSGGSDSAMTTEDVVRGMPQYTAEENTSTENQTTTATTSDTAPDTSVEHSADTAPTESSDPETGAAINPATLTASPTPAVTVHGDGTAWTEDLLELLAPYQSGDATDAYLVPKTVAEEVIAQYEGRYTIEVGSLNETDNLLVLKETDE
jgi:hypothetical protein